MIKKLLILSLSFMLLNVPSIMAQDIQKTQIENEQLPVTVSVVGNTINVKNAQNLVMEVYDITGKKVAAIRIESNDKTYELSFPRGCYIIKIGSMARKVYLKDKE